MIVKRSLESKGAEPAAENVKSALETASLAWSSPPPVQSYKIRGSNHHSIVGEATRPGGKTSFRGASDSLVEAPDQKSTIRERVVMPFLPRQTDEALENREDPSANTN